MQRIMREYAGKGPYSLLYRLHEDKRRASVMIRRVNRYALRDPLGAITVPTKHTHVWYYIRRFNAPEGRSC